MVQVLPYVPGFGERIAPALEQAASTIGGALMQKRAFTALQKLEQETQPQLNQFSDTATNQINQIAQQNGVASQLSPMQILQRQKLATQALGPELGKAYGNALIEKQKLAEKEAIQLRLENLRAEKRKERDVFKTNEPAVKELNKDLQDLEMEDTRLGRLQELYSDPSKFPSPLLVSLFTKNGEINPIAASQLSPEAQEATKLLIDSLAGAQAFFGGRVTNFDAATYLKRNATLINTPEGRERILNDLRALNEMTRKHAEGVLDIIAEKGGTDKISISSAENIFRKRHKKEIDQLRERFIRGHESKALEKFDPSKYKGRKLVNDDTGEVFESNGKEWIPVSGGQ